jgi:hypothetical protein
MRKGLWLFLLPTLLVLIAYVAMASLVEYAQTGRCYRNGSTLSTEELHSRAARNLLFAWMEDSARGNEYKPYYHAFLIRKSLTSNDVINAITSKSISNLPQEAVYPLQTDRDVASIAPNFLRGEFSIVRYRSGAYVEIIPSKSIEVVEANAAREFIDGMKTRGIGLSLLEKVLGYGNHVYRIDYYGFVDLGCCEELYSKHPKDGKPPEWYARSNIDLLLRGEQPSHRNLVVSNCGEVLQRSAYESTRFLF